MYGAKNMSPYKLECGNSKELLKTLADNSIDAIVTDPPYELGFMGKKWDASGIAYDVDLWRECLRVLKPGGHLLAFSGSRTYHRMTVAIEDAGFDIRDQIMWLYGSGFPKSHDVSKAIDKLAGAEREAITTAKRSNAKGHVTNYSKWERQEEYNITAPATDAAKEWNGWGTALKPAHEPICVARKPLIGTVAENVLTHGTGGINVDGCRVGNEGGTKASEVFPNTKTNNSYGNGLNENKKPISINNGRWPANIIHDGSAEVLAGFPESSGGAFPKKAKASNFFMGIGAIAENRMEMNDKGSAARFFYCAKASKKDRDEGLEGFEEKPYVFFQTGNGASGKPSSLSEGLNTQYRNTHPTVKPTNLMQYLCRLVTPPNGVILDPFLGSGSTGKAAIYEGFQFVGFDLSAEYVEISRARIEYAMQKRNETSKQKENTLFED
jgi:site-specific DNA-methyltransferase (adenine-specific)